jgi:hypothetical protein
VKSEHNLIDAVDFVSVNFTNWSKVYTILISGDVDRPLSHEGRIVFFHQKSELVEAKSLLSGAEARLLKNATSPIQICDVKLAIDTLSEGQDDNQLLLHSINFLLDCVNFIGKRVPSLHEDRLFDLADALSFHPRIPKKFGNQKAQIRQSLLWCQFAVTNESIFLETLGKHSVTRSPLVQHVRA